MLGILFPVASVALFSFIQTSIRKSSLSSGCLLQGFHGADFIEYVL